MISTEQAAVLERFSNSAPVDVTALAEALGITVWEDDGLPDGASGQIAQDPFLGTYSITVRGSDPYVRKRFTLAHEIAHFLLHKKQIGTSLTDDALYRSGLPTWQEVQANKLAADILMPRNLVNENVRRYGPDPAVLAKLFDVSESAMRIRLGLPSKEREAVRYA